jgi:glucose/arabinose dehydrogenase
MTSLFRRPGAVAALIAVGALACGGSERNPGSDGTGDSASTAAASTPDSITVPAGFQVAIFADSLGEARQIAIRPNGDVYLNTRHSPRSDRSVPPGGFLVALRDTNRDGRADQIQRFGAEGGDGGTGIAFHKDALYAEVGGDIVRYRLEANQLVPSGRPETVVTGLPTELGHTAHPFAIDLDGNLFVNSGSATNSCQEKDRQVGSPGERPCKELATRAGIWRFSANKTGQRFDADARYATGIRNTGALAINPVDGALYAAQHGRDQLGENWPKLFDWKESAELPAEELLQVVSGGDYGWPYCYHDPRVEKLVLAPEYGGDGKKVGECAGKLGPAAAFPAHWAPNGLAFYTGTSFPESYRNGAFIAFHGSWNRAPEPQQGYNVVFQPFSAGKPSGKYQIFADGFAGPRKEPGLARHRPTGVAMGPDGALYISDDSGGRLWRVTYRGS